MSSFKEGIYPLLSNSAYSSVLDNKKMGTQKSINPCFNLKGFEEVNQCTPVVSFIAFGTFQKLATCLP